MLSEKRYVVGGGYGRIVAILYQAHGDPYDVGLGVVAERRDVLPVGTTGLPESLSHLCETARARSRALELFEPFVGLLPLSRHRRHLT